MKTKIVAILTALLFATVFPVVTLATDPGVLGASDTRTRIGDGTPSQAVTNTGTNSLLIIVSIAFFVILLIGVLYALYRQSQANQEE